jgi:uncharacterized protein (UPF0548 family)
MMAVTQFIEYRGNARARCRVRNTGSMFYLKKPDLETIREFLAAQKQQKFSYAPVGASRNEAPTGYIADHNRIQLSQGRAAFERAKDAIKQWKMFDIAWLELFWPNTPIEEGATVAIAVSHLGFWSLNAARIVYTIEEHGALERYGFAYGTLPDHAEMGEERFTVEFQADDDTVWYDLYAFSRPRPLASTAYPYTRALQKKFAADSKKAMLRTVRDAFPARF